MIIPTIQVETMRTREQLRAGMQGRDSLRQDRGMLFVHSKDAHWPYWMFRVHVPLDIVWLDSEHRIVSIVENAQPCPSQPCPDYRPDKPARFVLELAGGMARKLGLHVGQWINCEGAAA